MGHKKKTVTLGLLLGFVFFGVAASQMRAPKERNLKVLPQDISDFKLDSIMQTYNKALGVNCNFCHSEAKAQFPVVPAPGTLDFSLDNSMKEQGRRMMRLNIEINKNFFYYDSTKRPEYLNVITCKTCHQGHIFPPAE